MSGPTLPNDRGETLDPFYRGRFRFFQGRKGYRFSVDAPLLADFVRTRPADELLELGTGSGVISILLSIKPFARITALEVQERLAGLARRNVALNGLDDRIEIVRGDFRAWDPGRRFDAVFSNPPYIRGRRGQLAADEEKSVAKHEIMGDINDIMRATRAFLKADGRAYFVYPGKRRKDFEDAVSAQNFGIGALRPVLSREGEEASLFLAMCGPSFGGEPDLPPLVLYGPDGGYTSEAEAIFSGRTAE
jgi:tRNA1(Val) A37 N6-methylase TrmN6